MGKDKKIRELSMEMIFDCGGRVRAVIDYRNIKPNINVIANSTSNLLDFMLDSSDINIRDQLPLSFERENEIPISQETAAYLKTASKKEIKEGDKLINETQINPLENKLYWANLKKRGFIQLLNEQYEQIPKCSEEIQFALDNKFKALFDMSLFTLINSESGKEDMAAISEKYENQK